MQKRSITFICPLTLLICGIHAFAEPIVVMPKGAKHLQELAGKEIRRYVYMRTGAVLELKETNRVPNQDAIIITVRNHKLITNKTIQQTAEQLGPQEFSLKTTVSNGRKIWWIVGGDDVGMLYGAYRFAEKIGVRFYLHGDVVPDERCGFPLPDIDERGKPVFELRGIQPFHDFGEGPDWWNTDDHSAILSQLAKMRMNFIGFHTYPARNPATGPEASVWHGLKQDIAKDGRVRFSYPAGYFTTRRGWRITPMATGEFCCGASQLFETDDYGNSVMQGYMNWPEDPQGCNEVFNRVGAMFNVAFTTAHNLGIKTCLGTEAPLSIPPLLEEHLKTSGLDIPDPVTINNKPPYPVFAWDLDTTQKIYEGTFERIKRSFPLNYYWLWTEESWLGRPPEDLELDATQNDLLTAAKAAKTVDAPFTLATCGWVLGPIQNPSQFDTVLPKDFAFSCINRHLGHEPVEKQFAEITGRSKWAIPWLEDDGLILPGRSGAQLWAGRLYRDAIDAWRYGCNGLMGIHWRTRILSPNCAALAQAAWDWKGTTANQSATERSATIAAFYQDWALAQFGPSVADTAAAIFLRYDGQLPGAMGEDPARFDFIEELDRLKDRIVGEGNRERFNYWLDTFRSMRALNQFDMAEKQFHDAMAEMRRQPTPELKKQIAVEKALPARIRAVQHWEEAMNALLSAVSTNGELGTVSNLEQTSRVKTSLMTGSEGEMELRDVLGGTLPSEAMLSDRYQGRPRIIVPTLRSTVKPREKLNLKIIVLIPNSTNGTDAVSTGNIYWRRLGQGQYQPIPLSPIGRSVYHVTLPAAKSDFEYYISVETKTREKLYWPSPAPTIVQTVVVWKP